MQSPQQVQSIINESRNGANQFFKHFLGFVYTDGIRELCHSAESFWLIDLIGSYQRKCNKHNDLQHFQIWLLKVKDGEADIYCFADSVNGKLDPINALIHQHIPYTTFPVSEVKLYLENGCLMFPTER